MRIACLMFALIVATGCAGTGRHHTSKTTDCDPVLPKPTFLQRMGLRPYPAVSAEELPPVTVEKTTETEFAPARTTGDVSLGPEAALPLPVPRLSLDQQP